MEPTYIPGESYRKVEEVPPPTWMDRMKKFVKENLGGVIFGSIVALIVGSCSTIMCMVENKMEKDSDAAKANGLIYLQKNSYTNIRIYNVWAPQGGFSVGTGCLGMTHGVNFAASNDKGKYVEGTVCCTTNSTECRWEKYFEK